MIFTSLKKESTNALCGSHFYRAVFNGESLYCDDNHLSIADAHMAIRFLNISNSDTQKTFSKF